MYAAFMPQDAAISRRARESIGDRIQRRRRELRMTQQQLAAAAGVNQGFISQIERGDARPRPRTLDALAVALNIPQGVLLGGKREHDNPQPLESRELPLLGSIPAGPPAQSQEQLEMFPVLRHMWAPDYYCLRLSFDSMEPTLKPGDIVLVHYRPDVEPEHVQGRICACLVDGEPTLKRVTVETRKASSLGAGNIDLAPHGASHHRRKRAKAPGRIGPGQSLDGNKRGPAEASVTHAGDEDAPKRVIILRGDNPRVAPMVIDENHDFSIQGIVLRLVAREL
jgi:repressor LexA